MSNLMKIGELAKQTGLSIRTLHYYDAIELLSPSNRNESGHRLYNDQDIIRLQHILSLRQLGFSLSEIHECLENPEFSLPKVIELHCRKVREQMKLSRTLLKRLEKIAHTLQTNQEIAVEHLMKAMETMTISEQYMTAQQETTLETRFQEKKAEWQEMLVLAQFQMSQDADPHISLDFALAEYWRNIMKFLIRGDEELYQFLAKMYHQEEAETATWGTMDSATFDYILKAIAFSSITEDIPLQISEQNYTKEAIKVIRLAQNTMKELKYDVVGTEAILLGLMIEGQSIAAQLLKQVGITNTKVKHQIEQRLANFIPISEEITTAFDLPFAPRAKRVLELTKKEAKQLGNSCIAPEHLLLGILKETKEVERFGQPIGIATRILREDCQLNLQHFEQQLISAIIKNNP